MTFSYLYFLNSTGKSEQKPMRGQTLRLLIRLNDIYRRWPAGWVNEIKQNTESYFVSFHLKRKKGRKTEFLSFAFRNVANGKSIPIRCYDVRGILIYPKRRAH